MVQIRHFRSVSVMDEKVFDPPPLPIFGLSSCIYHLRPPVPGPSPSTFEEKKNSSLYLETPSCLVFFLLSGKEEKGGNYLNYFFF